MNCSRFVFSKILNCRYLRIFLFLVISVLVRPAYADELMMHKTEAIQALYHFRFQDADSIIGILESEFPENYLTPLTRSNYYWWKIISNGHNPQVKENYHSSLLLAERFLPLDNKTLSPEEKFHTINLYAFRARLDLMEKEYLRATRHLTKSVGFIRNTLKNDMDFMPFNLTSGLYNYMAAYGEQRYPFFRLYSLVYPRGDKERGLEQLRKAARGDDELVKTEANYFLMKIFLELENDLPAALQHAQWLAESYPCNLVFLFHYYEILLQMNHNSEAGRIKTDYIRKLESNIQLTSSQKEHLRSLL